MGRRWRFSAQRIASARGRGRFCDEAHVERAALRDLLSAIRASKSPATDADEQVRVETKKANALQAEADRQAEAVRIRRDRFEIHGSTPEPFADVRVAGVAPTNEVSTARSNMDAGPSTILKVGGYTTSLP